jgi:signal transduction histidine kinase
MLELKYKYLSEPTIEAFIEKSIKPSLASEIKDKAIRFVYEHGVELNDKLRGGYKMDWSVYKSILFHIISNAIKHSHKGSQIIIRMIVD